MKSVTNGTSLFLQIIRERRAHLTSAFRTPSDGLQKYENQNLPRCYTMFLRKTGDYSPIHTAQHPRRLKYADTLLWEPQSSQCLHFLKQAWVLWHPVPLVLAVNVTRKVEGIETQVQKHISSKYYRFKKTESMQSQQINRRIAESNDIRTDGCMARRYFVCAHFPNAFRTCLQRPLKKADFLRHHGLLNNSPNISNKFSSGRDSLPILCCLQQGRTLWPCQRASTSSHPKTVALHSAN
jgi:hypothetical protein